MQGFPPNLPLRGCLFALMLGVLACFNPNPLELESSEPSDESGHNPGLSITPNADTLNAISDTLHLSVRLESREGTLDSDAVTWRSLNRDVAVVTGLGEVIAMGVGTALITAGCGGCTYNPDTARVYVHQVPASVTVLPSGDTLTVGDRTQFRAAAVDSNGVAIAGAEFTWQSSDPGVARVNAGLVEGRAAGSVSITANAGVARGRSEVTVRPERPSPGPIPAFPGAEGYGAAALNSCHRRNAQVFTVTNLNDAGPGSFRQALADAEAAPDGDLKVVTFRVSGYIETLGGIDFTGNCLYIAGQTAPGDGVTIRGRGPLQFHRDPRDIVIRYLRIRLGNSGHNDNGILVRGGTHYLFDHLSLSWSPRTLLRFSRTQINRSGPISNVTVQHSLLGESLSGHPTALQVGGEPDTDGDGVSAGWRDNTHYSIHHNALVSNSHRNPNARGLYIEVINNVIHNWNLDAGQTGREAVVDFLNNYTQKGPMSRASYRPIGVATGHVLEPPFYEPSIYAVGNLSLGGSHHSDQNTDPNVDNWHDATRVVAWYQNEPSDEPIPQFRRDHRLDGLVSAPIFPVTVQSPYEAWESVLSDVGANKGLDCAGRWFPRADAVDQRLIQEARDGGGWADRPGPDHESAVGGYPILEAATPCADSDGDGLPDEWETANGLNPKDPADSRLIGLDGYSYLEYYLNGTTP